MTILQFTSANLAVCTLLLAGIWWSSSTGRGALLNAIILLAAIWDITGAAFWAAHHSWLNVAVDVLFGAVMFWLWSRDRENRRRTAQWLGAKSRALRDKLTRSQREATHPVN